MGIIKPEELQKAPKQFCENIKVGFTPEYFILGMSSGAVGNIYALTPGHMKRLSQYLTDQVSRYEDAHGHIDAEWNPNVPSPLQNELRDGGLGGEDKK